jgi:competence protein ComFB
MEFFNVIEMVVKDIVDDVLARDEKYKSIKYHRNDIIAYVLNRIPPRYVTGERGIIHTRIDPALKYQQHTDMLFLIYESMELFSKRRPTEIDDTKESGEKFSGLMPHILGEVLEETTLSIIPDLKVILLYYDEPAAMMDQGWKNPYITTKATRGYYHFWPGFIKDKMGENDPINFKISFQHPKFREHALDLQCRINRSKNAWSSVSVPLVLLKLKDGQTADFLTREQ